MQGVFLSRSSCSGRYERYERVFEIERRRGEIIYVDVLENGTDGILFGNYAV